MTKRLDLRRIYSDDILLDVGDINGDGEKEIVTIRELKILAFSGKKKEQLSLFVVPSKSKNQRREYQERNVLGDFVAGDTPLYLKLADVDGDGRMEIFVVRADNVAYITNQKGRELWSMKISDNVKSISVADIDKDNRDEIFLHSKDGNLYIIEKGITSIKGKQIFKKMIVDAFSIGDINNDNELELVILTREGKLFIMTSNLKKISEIDLGVHLLNPRIVISDINGDGIKEITISGERGILVFVESTGKYILREEEISSVIFLKSFDIDNDGIDEIILGGYNGELRVFKNINKIYEKEESTRIKLDIDNDGIIEEIYKYWKEVGLVKKGTKVWTKMRDSWIVTLSVGDIDSDGFPEILFGDLKSNIMILDRNGEIIWFTKLPMTPMVSAIADFDGDGTVEILVGSLDSLNMFKIKS